ncbi:U11/U12 small nuclear ribonucleoprotein 48 kDa protein isoform X2 [Temnothorax longispinosus]|uniref:U11/U12 small nuclear ribonucleoprotein 48 kDa protein isoform X2 n=1 Tax=Temnothorax longispinosus TaxID=300112 RepID=UPI003A99ACF5
MNSVRNSVEISTLKNMSDSREEQLEELRSFTDAVNEEIASIVGTLGWTMESVTNDTEYLTCPYDSSHRLTESSLNDHLASCQWKAEGYGKLDVPLSEPTLPADSPFCIKFDEELQEQVLRKAKEQNPTMKTGMGERLVPRTSDRVIIDFTSDERKALYDYVIANTAKPDIGEDIANINNLEAQQKRDKELSFLELLIRERNFKRRRAKHRGVHTNKKSHTEILREVIDQQMEMYVDYISGESNSGRMTDVSNTKTDDTNYEKMQDRTERLNKVFLSKDPPSRDYNDYNSGDRNGHHHKKQRDNQKRDHSEDRSYHRSRDRDKQERYSDATERKHRHEYRKSSRSRERKSHHKKDKRRSKDKYYEQKHKSRDRDKSSEKHKSRDRDKSSERHYSKHSDYKRKDRSKEY